MGSSEFREILLQSMRILESFTKDIFEKGNKQQVFDFYELGLNKTNIDYFDIWAQKWGSYGFCVPDNCESKIFSKPPKDDNELRFIIDTYCNTEELLRLFNMLKEKDLNKKDLEDAIKLYELEMYKPCVLLIYSLIDNVIISFQPIKKDKYRFLPNKAGERIIDGMLDKEWINYFYALNTKYALEEVYKKGKDFVNEDEYIALNRQFVSHGMTKKIVNKYDCIVLFLLLYRCSIIFNKETPNNNGSKWYRYV